MRPTVPGAWPAHAAASLLLLGLLAMTTSPARRASLPDFDKAYYPAGAKILSDPGSLYDAPVVDFVNAPIVALLFTPLTWLEPRSARLAFSALGVLAVAVTVVWLARAYRLGPWTRTALLAVFVLNGPLHYSFGLGNASHLLLPLLLALFLAERAGRHAALGALAALAGVVKIPLLMLSLHFALRRRWRALGAFAATLAGVLALSALCFGLELHRTWFERCIRPFARGPLAAYNVQSVNGLLARLTTQASRHDWSPVEAGVTFHAARALLAGLLVGGVVGSCWRPLPASRAGLDLSIVLTLALLLSPISWTHYYAFLLLPLGLLIGGLARSAPRGAWRPLVALAALLVSFPVLALPGRAGRPLYWLYRGTAHSPHLLGGALLLGALLWARRRALAAPHAPGEPPA